MSQDLGLDFLEPVQWIDVQKPAAAAADTERSTVIYVHKEAITVSVKSSLLCILCNILYDILSMMIRIYM